MKTSLISLTWTKINYLGVLYSHENILCILIFQLHLLWTAVTMDWIINRIYCQFFNKIQEISLRGQRFRMSMWSSTESSYFRFFSNQSLPFIFSYYWIIYLSVQAECGYSNTNRSHSLLLATIFFNTTMIWLNINFHTINKIIILAQFVKLTLVHPACDSTASRRDRSIWSV